ncbi:MAG: AMP-binding protein [Chloroflexota bacterium]|nr:AMP-binding protein [Chloroflexota bacterium]
MSTIVGNRTLRQLLEYRVATIPDEPFVIYDDLEGGVTRLSYAMFDAQVNRTANVLRALGVSKGDKINIHLPNCLEFLYLWFGAAKIGAVMVPTNILSVPAELEYLIGHSESRFIFTQARYLATINEVRQQCPMVERVIICGERALSQDVLDFGSLLAEHSAVAPAAEITPLDDVSILYTSGTTSRPKGVQVTNANYIYAGETVAKAIRLAPDDRHYIVLPLFHANAQYYSTMSALVAGASIVLMARFSASSYFDSCIAHNCTVGSLFAAPIRMILAQEWRPEHHSNKLRVVLTAQNVTAAQLDEWVERFAAPLLQLYGMTETMGPPLMNPMDYERKNLSIGLPVLGYEVKLVDEDGKAVPQGQIGQILVFGRPGWSIMNGYYKNSEATAQTIREGWIWTGDNAYQDSAGYFHFVERAKDMIKRAGENVAASEVEGVILQHPKVFDCAVIGIPDPLRDEAIKAFVVLHEHEQATDNEIIEWCSARLAKFRVPEFVEFTPELPRTSVGKIQKHVLRRQEGEKKNSSL